MNPGVEEMNPDLEEMNPDPEDQGGEDAEIDSSQPSVCGDGETSGEERCDGDCPTSPLACDDQDACTTDSLEGSAAACSALCLNEPIVTCDGGTSDGCCPAGCTEDTDADCGTGNDDKGVPGSACTSDDDCGDNGLCDQSEGRVDGYCYTSLGCQSSQDCGGDGLCVQLTTGTTGCVDTCESIDDCREGYDCINAGGQLVCFTPQPMGEGLAGNPCTANADCGQNGFCQTEAQGGFPGGYCIGELGCRQDSDCGGDNLCFTLGQSGQTGCLDGCTGEADCRDGYECFSTQGGDSFCNIVPEMLTGETGKICGSDADCDDAEVCILEAEGFGGGYCTRECEDDDECPMGSHCGNFSQSDPSSPGTCLDDCASDAECRVVDGYACGDRDFDAVNECYPSASGPNAVGAACTTRAECGGGVRGSCFDDLTQGFINGYCTSSCRADADCAAGSHCTSDPDGLCVPDCATDADCRTADGYVCGDTDLDSRSECAPGGTGAGVVGAACTVPGDCSNGAAAQCFSENKVWTGGYCSARCLDDTMCGSDAHCAFLDPNAPARPGNCIEGCSLDTDCRVDAMGNPDGYVCADFDNDLRSECVPGGTGSAQIGEACTLTKECAGGLGAVCWDDVLFTNGYCLDQCEPSDPNACPGDAFCYDFNQGMGQPNTFCVDGCTVNTDCRQGEGYSCLQFTQSARGCWVN